MSGAHRRASPAGYCPRAENSSGAYAGTKWPRFDDMAGPAAFSTHAAAELTLEALVTSLHSGFSRSRYEPSYGRFVRGKSSARYPHAAPPLWRDCDATDRAVRGRGSRNGKNEI